MDAATESRLRHALALTPSQRSEPAALLIDSLDEDDDDSPEEIEAAWAEEIRRRLAEIDRGQSVPLSLDEFERRVTERSWRFESGPMLPLPTKSATHIDGIVVRAYCKPVGF